MIFYGGFAFFCCFIDASKTQVILKYKIMFISVYIFSNNLEIYYITKFVYLNRYVIDMETK